MVKHGLAEHSVEGSPGPSSGGLAIALLPTCAEQPAFLCLSPSVELSRLFGCAEQGAQVAL
eukprot:9706506-Alexandrium_andersonii.AAC.1